MRPVLELRVPEEAAQGDLEVMQVMEVVKENLVVAVARELTVAAKEDTAVAREAMAVEVKAEVVAEEADEEGRGKNQKKNFTDKARRALPGQKAPRTRRNDTSTYEKRLTKISL